MSGYVAAVVTVTDPKATKSMGVLGDPAAAGITFTEHTLPDQVKVRFEAEKIEVHQTNGAPVETAYVFKDGHGEVTENEFIRRYHRVTASNDLDEAEAGRRPNSALLGAIGAGTGVLLTTVGLIAYKRTEVHRSEHGGTKWAVTAVVGGSMVLGFGGLALYAAGQSDGTPADHNITKFDADLYAARYNRALLRKTIRDTERRMRSLSAGNDFQVMPLVSGKFFGVTGTF